MPIKPLNLRIHQLFTIQ